MPKLVIGTRGSPLALAQAREFQAALLAANPSLDPDAIEMTVIRTGADKQPERPIAELGGKGLFVKEIEDALLAGRIDVAVHSVKDLPGLLPEGLELACVLPRADPRDAFISLAVGDLADLPPGSSVGTSSPRRAAQILARRPDLEIRPLRGNVATRLKKLGDGAMQATILAMAGLNRLGLADAATSVLAPEVMLPAAGQGAIGAECRGGDARTRGLLAATSHEPSETRVRAERAFLAALGGSCRTPIAGLAVFEGRQLIFNGLVASLDGKELHRTARRGEPEEAAAMGRDAGAELKAKAGPRIFEATPG
jgi:hydroxymethylbilane synthase